MSRPPYRPTPTQVTQPRRSRVRRAARMTVGVTLLLAVATGVTVGAAAYSKNSATDSAAVAPTSAESSTADVRDTDVASNDQEARDLAEMGQSREVIPGVSVKIGELRTYTDPTGLRATTLPLQVVNTGALTRSVDITIVAISDKGEVITTDIGTAANLRPGQFAEVQVLELVDNAMAEQLAGATFRIEEAYAY
ncbi:hypothetical protein [Sporichthya sp.]|uniref:hypothetical protein n=1 Tax=Sporichthya sp. TaxID=65475 RepID=UPI0017FA1363|nr:hypothetical protein [Sporichthya sp.]MBA3741655.1 hypothetical protein [Sporichthya sp.]